ncbi:MAG TPA: hypothetical protein VFJ77_01835 [Gaiellaceae bacterium]|nr:hypothetical protein [Gaiellaceae bacterium]
MTTALGLLTFVLYVAAIVGAAAGITWVVVRFTPTKQPDSTKT